MQCMVSFPLFLLPPIGYTLLLPPVSSIFCDSFGFPDSLGSPISPFSPSCYLLVSIDSVFMSPLASISRSVDSEFDSLIRHCSWKGCGSIVLSDFTTCGVVKVVIRLAS